MIHNHHKTKHISILKHNLMRATMTLALIVTCATAWADNDPVSYIDADGTTQTCTDYTVLHSGVDITELCGGWYVVSENVEFSNVMRLLGTVHIILCDDKTITINVGDGYNAIWSVNDDLFFYGQSGQTGTLTATATDNSAINVWEGNLIINGGIINASGEYGLYANKGNVIINGGKVTATGTTTGNGIESLSGNIVLGWTRATDYIHASSYMVQTEGKTVSVAPGLAFLTNDNPAQQVSGTVTDLSLINGKTLTPDVSVFSDFTVSTDGNTYTIWNAYGWGLFCDALEGGESFSGKTVKLGADITVSRIAGSGNGGDLTTSDHPFCGTFDGQGYTLTFNYGSSSSPADANNLAPFRYVNNATIEHLHVDGDIYTQHAHTAGIVGQAYGTTNITDCRSSVNIISSINGDGTHGGIMSCSWTGSTTNITGCLFDGSIQSASNYTTDQCGGFVGRRNGTINVTNSLLTATFTNIEVGTGDYPSATFVCNPGTNATTTITNSYYTHALGTEQGTKVYSITAGENVTVDYIGTPTNTYAISGIATYPTGIKCNDVLYAGDGDVIILSLSHSEAPTGYTFTGFSASAGALDGTTLTMPNEDVTIYAIFSQIPVTYINELGVEAECDSYTLLTSSMFDLGTANTETWYVADGTISFAVAIVTEGDVHIILKDGAIMNVGTENSPVGDKGIVIQESTVSIYGQSTGEDKGRLNVYANETGIAAYTASLTINGGQVTVTATGDYVAIYTIHSDLTINGGCVTATGNYNGINAEDGNVIINGGQVTATGDNCGIEAFQGSVTISGGQVTATGSNRGINAFQGSVTINGGQVTATGDFGIYAYGGSVTINGGQVTATGNYNGIRGYNDITLGWTNPTDYIYANSYLANGTLTLTKTFIDEDGNTYNSGSIAQVGEAYPIDGKTLYPEGVIFKHITGYDNGNDKWVFIASPVTGSMDPSEVHNLLGENISTDPEHALYNFDLYRLNPSNTMWENYHAHTEDFNLANGQGYLYATKETKTLVFAGEYNTNTSKDVRLQEGWNLVGNPFDAPATVNMNYFRMNEEGTAIEAIDINLNSDPIEMCTGIVVKPEATRLGGPTITFTRVTTPQNATNNKGGLQIALSQVVEPVETPDRDGNGPSTLRQAQGPTPLDNAIVSFNEGSQLGKFYFGTQNANIYIPQDGEEYAIVSAGNVGEIPVNFKAHENGTYTLTVSSTLNSQLSTLNFHYLHLIDNMTGADVDLLALRQAQGPASYTFEAKTTDYESRFKLVFSAKNGDGPSTGSGAFAFISNGNIIIPNASTDAVLQVVDATGRIIVSGDAKHCVSTSGMTPGVYVLRLMEGKDVKTQKIVVK